MQLEDLKRLVPTFLAGQLDEIYAAFAQDQGQGVDRFLEHLRRQGLIDEALFLEIHAQDNIAVSNLDATLALALEQTREMAVATEAEADEDATLVNSGDQTIGYVAASPADRPPPRLRHAMLGVVGEGAMGQVMLAKDQNLQRKVAYKQIHRQIAANRKVLSRFVSEAQITAQLDHPHIIPIYSLEVTPEGSIGYSMKLIKGRTFKDLIKEAREQYSQGQGPDEAHSLPTLLQHFLKVCDALHYAHTKGVIHRDLKPANIMIGPFNEVYVMDWGIARLMQGCEEAPDEEIVKLIAPDANEPEMERTQLGQILGTPKYMSPQQAAGKNDELDGRSDLFALGLILFELVALRPAFTAKTPIELLKKVLKAEKEPLVHFSARGRIPGELAAIIHKATAQKPPQRYRDVQAFAEDIRRYLRGEETEARPDNLLQRLLRWMSQHRQATLALIAGSFLLCAAGVILSLYHKQATLLQVQEREKKLSPFLAAVAHQSQQLDSLFLKFEAGLASLAGSGAEAWLRGSAGPQKLFGDADFAAGLPGDLIVSPRYGQPISLGWPVFQWESGRSEPPARLARLLPLHQDLQRLFGQSQALVWAYLAFPQGASLVYPGHDGRPGQDLRQRAWYTRAVRQAGLHWQPPEWDARVREPLLACATAFYDDQRRLAGVAALDISLAALARFLSMPGMPHLRSTYLLDSQGRILAASDRSGPTGPQQPELFPEAEVVAAVRAGRSGYTEKDGRLSAYYRLNAPGWYYVARVDTKDLIAGRKD